MAHISTMRFAGHNVIIICVSDSDSDKSLAVGGNVPAKVRKVRIQKSTSQTLHTKNHFTQPNRLGPQLPSARHLGTPSRHGPPGSPPRLVPPSAHILDPPPSPAPQPNSSLPRRPPNRFSVLQSCPSSHLARSSLAATGFRHSTPSSWIPSSTLDPRI